MTPPNHMTLHERVLASAGTGKTYALTSRFLELVLRGADPSRILATTFTRVAAAEIRARVLSTAADAVLDPAKRAQLAQRTHHNSLSENDVTTMLRTLVTQLPQLSIQTIDSFIAGIAMVWSPELGLPTSFRTLESDEEATLEWRAIERTFEHAEASGELDTMQLTLESLGKGAGSVRSVAENLRTNTTKFLDIFYDSLVDPEALDTAWSGWLVESLATFDVVPAIAQLRAIAAGGNETAGLTKAVMKIADQLEVADAGDGLLRADGWAPLFSGGPLLKVHEEGSSALYSNKPLSEALLNVLLELHDRAMTVVQRDYGRRTASMFNLLQRFVAAREEVRSELALASFSDLLRSVQSCDDIMLQDELRFRLDGQIDHLMLDEFQDTSLAQWALLQPLALEIAGDPSGDRTFFCVGDVKQAIYGWRGGLPGILENLPQMIAEGWDDSVLPSRTLAKSFRSTQAVLDAVNTVFGSIDANPAIDSRSAPGAKAFAKSFEAHVPNRTDSKGRVELSVIEDPGEGKFTAAKRDALLVAAATDQACALHRAHPGQTVALLTPTNKFAGKLLAAVRERGVDATSQGGGSFLDCGATIVMLDALRLASHPGDRCAAYHVCHSPLGVLLGMENTDAAASVASALRRQLATHGMSGVIEAWFNQLAPQMNSRERGRIARLVLEAEQLDDRGERDWAFAARVLETVGLGETGGGSVHVLTIHKAKGLEFDHVILSGLESRLFKEPQLAVCRPTPPGHVASVLRWTPGAIRPSAFEPMHDETRADSVRERLAQLYVAMTRARDSLYLIVGPNAASAKAIKAAPNGIADTESMAGILRMAFDSSSNGAVVFGEPIAPTPTPAAADMKTAIDTPRLVVGPPNEPLHAAAPSSHATTRKPMPQIGGADEPNAAHEGTALHHIFELITFLEEGTPSADAMRAHLQEAMGEYGPAWCDAQVEVALTALESPAICEVLAREPLDPALQWAVANEFQFARLDAQSAMQEGIIDRLVIGSADGSPRRASIVDWKSDRVLSGDHAAHAERYREQLLAYREAVAHMTGLDESQIETQIVFLRDGIVIDPCS